MPRMRVIKPEFWSDEKIARFSLLARLTYIGLWNLADDYGVVKGNPLWIKGQLFPYDEDIDSVSIHGALSELEVNSKIIGYEQSGETFFLIPKFSEHQTINRKSKTRNPEPPNDLPNTTQLLSEHSLNSHGVLMDISKKKEVGSKKKEVRNRRAKTEKSDHQIFVDWWCMSYKERFGDEYDFKGGKDGTMVSQLVAAYDFKELRKRATRFMQTDDQFWAKNGYSLSIFKSNINSFSDKMWAKKQRSR